MLHLLAQQEDVTTMQEIRQFAEKMKSSSDGV